MGRAPTDHSASGHGAPARRRLRSHRRRSPTPSSTGQTSHELTPSPSATESVSPPPSAEIITVAYAVVAPLPVFRGDHGECPDAHLARFDRVCGVNNVASPDAAARMFPASLDADAALWYDCTVSVDAYGSPSSWDEVRAAFLDFFRAPGAADRARAELMSLRQRPGEAVNRYRLRMQGILMRCTGGGEDVPDAFLKDAFVDGLRAEFQDWVVPQQAETLDEAVALALSWERAESVREARREAKAASDAVGGRCGFCDEEGHEEARCEMRSRMRELCLRRKSSITGRGGVVVKEVEEEEGGGGTAMLARLGSAVSTRSALCQCRKHQCAKKAVVSELAGDSEGSGAA